METGVTVRVLKVPDVWRFACSCLLGMAVGGTIVFVLSGSSVADTGVIEPNGDGSVSATQTGCGGNGNFDCLDDGVTEPTTPSTGSDYLTFDNNDTDQYLMETIGDVATATDITIWYYHVEGGTNAVQTIELFQSDGFTQVGTTQSVTTRTSAQWDSVTFSNVNLIQAELDGLRTQINCTKTGGGSSNTCTGYALYAAVTYDPQIEVRVSATGTQQNLDVGTTGAHVGGAFTVSELVGSRNVTSITLTETGSVDAAADLDTIELYYDIDNTSPYDCASESYDGNETQFGATDTDGFSGADGTATFTDSVGIATTQTMCVYPVLDVLDSASAGETIELEIADPSVDVVADGGADVQPSTTVAIAGTTDLLVQNLDQIHYHFRNDDGSESGATSATAGNEDTTLDTLGKESPIRLRLAVSNEGNKTSTGEEYRLEYAQKVTTCGAATGWSDVGASGGDWDMFDSSNLTEGADTTDIAVSTGGVTNENSTFVTPNGGVRDTSSQTGSITLTASEFVELEYSIISSSTASEGNTYCFRVTDAGTPIDTYSVYPEATILADVTVSSTGTQSTVVDIPTSDVYAGGTFVVTDNIAGDTTVQSITLSASGTVDIQNDIQNIELYYDLDTSSPYDCASESYNGTESQYGATDSDGFSANGTSTFTASQVVNPSQTMCLYVVYDVGSGAANDETLDIKIDNAARDVTIDTGTVAPTSLVDLSGTTAFVTDDARQVHYHWRNDDGDEGDTISGASSATGGDEDTTREDLRQNVPQRLRVEVANVGSASTPPRQYRLEYALLTSSCAAASGWTDVGASDGAFDMFDSPNVTDGADTTNIAVSSGGVTDEAASFLTDNNAVRDNSSQTGSITLAGDTFVELEYAIEATASSTQGATYCFRVTDAGTPIDAYDTYPEVTIKPRSDFFIQRGVFDMSGTSQTITAGVDYVAPSASTSAFIRITNTLNSGAGGGTTGNADDVTVYVSDPSNIENSITFTRPGTAAGNTRVAWEIIEYVGAPGGNNEMIVRQQSSATYGTGATTETTPTVPNVSDDNDIAVFITGQLNPDTTNGYPLGNSTAAWNAGTDTATFTRGASGNAAGVSYAVVEFTGNNWLVQRHAHTYSAVGTTETEAITAVNSLSRAFVHSQKHMGSGLNTHGDYGHQVWLSGSNQLSFVLDSTASTPGNHTSVAWVIENTETVGDTMIVTRSNGTQSGGTAPATVNVNIGTTLDDTAESSLFINNLGDESGGGGGQNSFPEPMLSARIISDTQYELWIADTNDSRSWRAEVVEWPTAARDITQNYYRFYENNDALDPTTPWPCETGPCGENTEVTGLDNPIAEGELTRIRMTLQISSAAMEPGIDSFKLQFGERTSTCTAIGEGDWHNVGGIGSTTALWRGSTTPVADGTELSGDPPAAGDLNISVSDVAGTFEEENNSALTPYVVDPGEDVEFDWVVEHSGAPEKTEYCFRMTEDDGTLLDGYNFYPVMRTAGYGAESGSWRWYDDAENETPSTPLAGTNTAPIDIDFENAIQLRLVLREINGADEPNAKFRLEFSESPKFASSTYVEEVSSCADGESLFCYADGGGVDNATITTSLIGDADSCSAGSGPGCGSHNESGTSSTTSEFLHGAGNASEFAFTIRHAGARVNRTYYFRVYDEQNGQVVPLASGANYPSLSTSGSSLVFTTSGLAASTETEGVTTDVDSSPASLAFSTLPFNAEVEAAHRLVVDTNGTEGYQVLMYATGELMNASGDTIDGVTGTNAAPTAWSTGCPESANGCVGYHSGDDVLSGGSTRFSADNTYARLSTTTAEELVFSTQPVAGETVDIIYKMEVRELQPAGEYATGIRYIAIPIF